MSALQLLRTSLGLHTRSAIAHGVARPAVVIARRAPQSASATRRFYSDKGKEKEDTNSNDQPKAEATNGATNGSADPTAGSESADLLAKLQAKQDEIVDLTGRLRYAQADFINLQRISAREKEQTRDFAISRFASDLLETADTLAMALRALPQPSESPSGPSSGTTPAYFEPSSQRPDAVMQGIEATQRILLQTLAKYGIKSFDPTGEKFDPNQHEALYSVPVPGKAAGEVLECQKIGYMIKDRVLRAAQVGVAAEHPSDAKTDTLSESEKSS